jgi:membrane-bound ClpP family serine protease
MSLLHRTRTDDGAVVVERDRVDQTVEPVATRTRQRSSMVAPGQIVSLIAGAGLITVGIIALIRAELDGSLSTPVVEVLGYTHTAWLGIAEIGVGLLLLLAGASPAGRSVSVVLGAAMVIAGVLVRAEPSQMPDELGIEKAFGWPLIIVGAIVGLAAIAMPVWYSNRVDRDTVLRDDPARTY